MNAGSRPWKPRHGIIWWAGGGRRSNARWIGHDPSEVFVDVLLRSVRTPEEFLISLADFLALIRIALVPVIMAFTRSEQIDHALGIAATLFAIAAFTDFLDGYVARRTTGGTTLGAFLDTTADKILVTGTLFALVSIDRVSIWPAVIIVFREFTVMALRGVVAERGGLIRPSTWGKIKALTQFTAIFWAFLRFPGTLGPWYFDEWLMLIAVVATVGSAWGYMSAFWYTIHEDDGGAVAVEVDSDGHRFMVPTPEADKEVE